MKIFRTKNSDSTLNQIRKPKSKWRYFIWGIVVLVLGVIGWLSFSIFNNYKKISTTNDTGSAIFIKSNGNISVADINTEGDSRINILIAGIGGVGHDGPDLTDTLQVMSVDPLNKTAAMLSVPRDLYVTQVTGERSKINAVNADGAGYCQKVGCAPGVDKGGAAMKDMVSKVLGIKISYFVRIDFNGFKQLVDAVGGVDINVATTLSDPFYPCPDPSTQYCPIYIKAGQHHFDGATALQYVRSRETTSDFDRSKRQQQILEAVKQKATTLGVLANPTKISQILNALGSNITTDLQLNDMLKLIDLVKDINTTDMSVNVLDTSATSPLTSMSDPNAGYIILPVAGINNYKDIHLFTAKAFPDPYITKENATITVVNATGSSAETVIIKKILAAYGYNLISVTMATKSQTQTTITTSSADPFTDKLLGNRFNATSMSGVSVGADITLTVGTSYLK